jgi:formylglycine-generating enzyme required for sulfatase activity
MPVHEVTVSSFYISEFEVTQAQYEQFDPEHRSWYTGGNRPVERVDWFDTVRFCNWLSQREGYECFYDQEDLLNEVDDVRMNWDANGYRLPTEAEWEYACRAGTSTDFYSGDLTYPDCVPLDQNLDAIGWYCGNADSMTHEVGEREPNSFGLCDMSGNVWEWCNDWYQNDYYQSSPSIDPTGPRDGSVRVNRGGSWLNRARNCRSANRDDFAPGPGGSDLGFRPVRMVQQ